MEPFRCHRESIEIEGKCPRSIQMRHSDGSESTSVWQLCGRSNFVSAAGVCLMINSRTNKKLLKRLGGIGFTSMANFISGGAMLWFATIPMLCRNQKYNWW